MKFVTLVIMVVVIGGLMRYARPYLMKAAGMPEGMPGMQSLAGTQFASEESDLMATVFQSALRLFTGSAKREQLASELSDKLYAGRADAGSMSELGIELVKAGADSSAAGGLLKSGPDSPAPEGGASPATTPPTASAANPKPGASAAISQPDAKPPARPGPQAGEPPAGPRANKTREAILAKIGEKAMANPELALVPVVFVGMIVAQRFRRRPSPEDAFMLPDLTIQTPTDSEPYDMTHAVHSLNSEDFELLVALIYQRQGYRVSMPAALGGGRGGDFMLLRKSERLLVQCKRLSQEHKVPVERVRELHDAMTAANATRGMYVASCGFSWDARNFAKARGVTLINARTLDTLITAAREKPDENLLAVSQWAPKLMSRVELTTPRCPTCEATMDQLNSSNGSVWVCSQRPDCRGRRTARQHQKPVPTAARPTARPADGVAT